MHKILVRIILIAGIFATISGCSGEVSASLTMNTLHLTDLAMALPACMNCHPLIPVQLSLLDDQAQMMNITANFLYRDCLAHQEEISLCVSCHDYRKAVYSNTTGDNVQSFRLPNHAGQIVECEVCHRQQPVNSFLLLLSEN